MLLSKQNETPKFFLQPQRSSSGGLTTLLTELGLLSSSEEPHLDRKVDLKPENVSRNVILQGLREGLDLDLLSEAQFEIASTSKKPRHLEMKLGESWGVDHIPHLDEKVEKAPEIGKSGLGWSGVGGDAKEKSLQIPIKDEGKLGKQNNKRKPDFENLLEAIEQRNQPRAIFDQPEDSSSTDELINSFYKQVFFFQVTN